MNKQQAQAVIDCLLGESKYGVEGLAHLDEFVPKDSPHYQNIMRVSKWFKEHGKDKTVGPAPAWVRITITRLQVEAAKITRE